MRKVTVLVNDAGEIIASYLHPERPTVSYTAEEPPSGGGILPSEGQEVLDLELPDEEVPFEPGPDFLETLQRYKDRGSS